MPASPTGRIASEPVDAIAVKREAFIQAERARREEHSPTDRNPSNDATSYQDSYICPPQRSLAIAYVLWFILGQISAHRFYLGRTQSAIIQVGLFFSSLMMVFSGPEVVGGIGLVVWCFWILGDVFVIHRIHRRDWKHPPSVGTIFS